MGFPTVPTIVQGVRDAQTLSTESRRVRDVAPLLFQLEPDQGPLTVLLSKLRMKEATDPKVEWFEDQLNPRFDTLGAALGVGDATMTVNAFKQFRSGDIVMVANAEKVLVTATPTSSAVSITRAYGTTAAQAAPIGAQLLILSNANQENASVRAIITTQKVNVINYLQIFRTPIGLTGTEMQTKTFAGYDKDTERNKALIEHRKDIELAFLFGEKKEDLTGAHPQRTTQGVVNFIQTNVKNVANLTEQEWEDFLRPCFRFGSREKVVLCSPKLIQTINGFSRSKLMTKSDESTYGITMSVYQNAGRKVMLVEHVLLSNLDLNDLSGIAGYGILLDIQDLAMRYMSGRGTMLRENIQAPDVDGEIDEYLAEVGLELHLEAKHGLITGVQG